MPQSRTVELPLHCEEERKYPDGHIHVTPGIFYSKANNLFLPHLDDCKTKNDIWYSTTIQEPNKKRSHPQRKNK